MVTEDEGAIAKVREIMGATNPRDVAPGTIRVRSLRHDRYHVHLLPFQ